MCSPGILWVGVNQTSGKLTGIFGDEVMAAALIDRLLHNCHLVSIQDNSYRIRHQQEQLRSWRSGNAEVLS